MHEGSPDPVRWGQPPGKPNYISPAPGFTSKAERVPDGVTWLKIYCGLQVAFFAMLLLGGGGVSVAMSLTSPASGAGGPPAWILGIMILVMGLPLLSAFVVGLVGPRKPWMYTYGILLAVLGFSCGGCWFIGIPFLIFWMRPETKHWFESAPQ